MQKINIRNWQISDAQALAAVANNRNVWNSIRNEFPSPYTVMDALAWIKHANEEKPVANFAIEIGHVVAGNISCMWHKDVYAKTVEVGYFIGENYWGKGIASAAVALILEAIKKNKEIVRIEAKIFGGNGASARVLEKNNFVLEGIRKNAIFKNGVIADEQVWVYLIA
ncbi:MAG: GNAT family N-acetyltransferase [Bacteroidota bacterium]|jgi:ribosomal-protein-alanine N-acetyltransferase